MKKSVFLALILILLCVPFSSASITLPVIADKYSLGDIMELKTSVQQNSEFNGYFKLILECDNSSNNFFSMPVSLKANEQESFDVPPITLTMEGSCIIHSTLSDSNNKVVEEKESNGFITSSAIYIETDVNKLVFSPNEKIKIHGTAVNYNGKETNAEALITLDYTYSTKVKNGEFSLEETLPKSMKSGEHTIIIKISDGKGNYGEDAEKITVKQIPTSIVVDTNENAFNPGEKIIATATLLDQADEAINNPIILTLYNSWGAEIERETVNGESLEYAGKTSDSPGNWWVYAYAENLKTRKFIYINEIKSIETIIAGNILNVTNDGNVDYKNPLTLNFKKSNETVSETIELDLAVGQSRSFKLSGDGDYRVEVKSSEFSKEFDLSLTGGTVGVKKVENPLKFIVAVLFVALIIVAAGVIRMRRKKIGIRETVTVNPSRI